MNLSKNPKQILILGVGGHGWQIFSDYLENTKDLVKMYGLTCDYGGSGGIWYRLQKINDFELNKKLHVQKKAILPWGDFNKIICHFLTKKHGKIVGEVLDFRSDDLETHRVNFEILSDHLVLEKSMHEEFWKYFCTTFEYYKKHKNNLNYETKKSFCFGYVWQDFVYWNLGKLDGLNEFYKLKNVLPKNLSLEFTHPERTILQGKNIRGQKLIGEELVDNSPVPVLPKSLELVQVEVESSNSIEDFLQDLENADKILIPTGSIANWLPLFRIPKVVNKLKQKNIFWFLNLAKTKNEMPLIEYIHYLVDLDMNLNLVTSNRITNLKDLGNGLELSIDKEEIDLLGELEVKVYYSLESTENWKYKPQSVAKFLQNYD